MVGRRKDQALVLRFYFDDYSLQLHRLSKSRICMNIQSVIVAIESYRKPIILILGGYNKGADFRLLLPHIKSSHVRDIISYGDAGGQINAELGDAVRSVQVTNLSSAVKKAHSLAAPGDIVLLSPGCASYDEFENFP